jgi:hypothetical protein
MQFAQMRLKLDNETQTSNQGSLTEREGMSTVDLLALTSLVQLLFYIENL